ncbi:MAG: hypothetical protein OXI24_20745 [Candidatus Poribacteria bacterium]|nr:hypothetical protein [Candidatus Poribacteria bacterium]
MSQDKRNFDRPAFCEMEILGQTHTFGWHNLTGYATKEQTAQVPCL